MKIIFLTTELKLNEYETIPIKQIIVHKSIQKIP